MSRMLEIPDGCQCLVAPFEKLLFQVQALLERNGGGDSVDYSEVEDQVASGVAAIERATHEVLLGGLDVDTARVLIGGLEHVRVGRYPATYYTMAGPIVVERSLYRAAGRRNGPTVDAVSLRAGVVAEGWLPNTARAMAHLLQQGTSREAEATAGQMSRLPYSRSSFERVGHEVGALYVQDNLRVEQALIEAYQVPQEATGLSVSLDRVSVPMEEPNPNPASQAPGDKPKRHIVRNFRMAYCGTVTLHDKDGKALHTIRYGRMPKGDAVGLCEGLASDVDELRKRRPDLDVTLLADGAEEMWHQLDEQLNRETLGTTPTRLVDFWHTAEKLGHAAPVLSRPRTDEVLAQWRLRLLNQSPAAGEIRDELRASGRQWAAVGGSHPIHDAITYLDNHADRMDYATARAQGRPIGSGNVEATCKSLFEVRIKRPGSRWKETTGEHIVQLRALALSDRWDDAMRLTLAPLRQAVRPAA